MKKLPSIYTNIDEKKIANNKKVFYSYKEKKNNKKEIKNKTPNQTS